MKHSSPNLMTESCDSKVVIPSTGHWDLVLKGLYVDLFNLIVESRIPGTNERGYGDGCHCPPLMGKNIHSCDLMKPECQKHQRLIHHLLRAVRHNIFEIDVLMLPNCCSESNLSEQIQSKEYILLERWSLKCVQRYKSRSTIEIPELLRAVRSFLHFSQISAWLSLTKGKSPANICYWVKPTSTASSAQFQCKPEIHYFPVCKVNDGVYGIVKVSYPARKQFIPIIPCSKHPTHHELAFRNKSNYQDLAQHNPLNPTVEKQLQNSCDNQIAVSNSKQFATDSESIKTSELILKTVTHNISNLKKGNRILKHSNSLMVSQNTSNVFSNSSSSSQICKIIENNSNNGITFLNNFRANSSQENLCLSKETFTTCMSREESKLSFLNNILHPSFFKNNLMPNETVHEYFPEQSTNSYCDKSSKLSDLEVGNIFDNSLLVQSDVTSQNISDSLYNCSLTLNRQKKCENEFKSIKRKQKVLDDVNVISHKKRKTHHRKKVEEIKNCCKEYKHPQNIIYQRSPKRKLSQSSIISKKTKLNIINTAIIDCESIAQECFKDNSLNISTSSKLSKLIAKDVEAEKSSIENDTLKQLQCKTENISQANTCAKVIKTNTDHKLNLFHYFQQNKRKSQVNEREFKQDLLINNSNSFSVLYNKLNPSKLDVNKETGIKNLKKISPVSTTQTEMKEDEIFVDKNEAKLAVLEPNVLYKSSSTSNNGENSKFFPQKRNKSQWNCNNSLKNVKKLVSKAVSHSNRKIPVLSIRDFYKNVVNINPAVSKLRSSKDTKKVKKSKKKSSSDFAKSYEIKKNKRFNENCLIQEKKIRKHRTEKTQDAAALRDDISQDFPSKVQHNQTESKDIKLLQNFFEIPAIENKTFNGKNQSCDLLCKVLPLKATSYHDCFPRNKLKFARGRKLLGNFEESILKGCLPSLNSVKGFRAEIGASGSFCPNHITLPADVSFYDLDSLNAGTSSYMAHVSLGEKEYYLPRKGAVQVTLFNPSETVVKMFVLNYDLSDMPPMCHTFIRQKTYYMPIGSTEECPSSKKWLRFVIHLRFATTKTGKIYLHEDFKIIVLNKSNDDAASEFSQEPRELRSFLHVPFNPTFSNL